MESVVVTTNQDIDKVNVKRHPSLKESVSTTTNKGTNLKNAIPSNGTQYNKLSKLYLVWNTTNGVDITIVMNLCALEIFL